MVKLSTQEFRTIINEKIRTQILRGKSRPEILRFIAEESERLGAPRSEIHCSNILTQVKHELREELKEIQGEIYTDLLGKLFYLYDKNMQKNDLKESRECLAQIAKMAGLSSGNQVQIAREDEVIQISFQ